MPVVAAAFAAAPVALRPHVAVAGSIAAEAAIGAVVVAAVDLVAAVAVDETSEVALEVEEAFGVVVEGAEGGAASVLDAVVEVAAAVVMVAVTAGTVRVGYRRMEAQRRVAQHSNENPKDRGQPS